MALNWTWVPWERRYLYILCWHSQLYPQKTENRRYHLTTSTQLQEREEGEQGLLSGWKQELSNPKSTSNIQDDKKRTIHNYPLRNLRARERRRARNNAYGVRTWYAAAGSTVDWKPRWQITLLYLQLGLALWLRSFRSKGTYVLSLLFSSWGRKRGGLYAVDINVLIMLFSSYRVAWSLWDIFGQLAQVGYTEI